MTLTEARMFFGMNEDDDPNEALDESLFQFKRSFTSQTILRPTFEAKLKKLKKVEEAADFFGIISPEIKKGIFNNHEFSDDILGTYLKYQKLKSILFLYIHSCTHPSQLVHGVQKLLELQYEYSSLWPEINRNDNTIILSKEIDTMELLSEIKKLRDKGVVTFDELSKFELSENNCVGIESQRLYLLFQKELEWKKTYS